FDASAFLERMRNKVFLVVGDSVSMNFISALQCLIETATPTKVGRPTCWHLTAIVENYAPGSFLASAPRTNFQRYLASTLPLLPPSCPPNPCCPDTFTPCAPSPRCPDTLTHCPPNPHCPDTLTHCPPNPHCPDTLTHSPSNPRCPDTLTPCPPKFPTPVSLIPSPLALPTPVHAP
ncbi:unnamed protein product, partial [Closterium sp. NIES-53]